jgi:hypothetical protein
MVEKILAPADALPAIYRAELQLAAFARLLQAQHAGMASCLHSHGPGAVDFIEDLGAGNAVTLARLRQDLRSIRHGLSEALALLGL